MSEKNFSDKVLQDHQKMCNLQQPTFSAKDAKISDKNFSIYDPNFCLQQVGQYVYLLPFGNSHHSKSHAQFHSWDSVSVKRQGGRSIESKRCPTRKNYKQNF